MSSKPEKKEKCVFVQYVCVQTRAGGSHSHPHRGQTPRVY